VQAGRVYLNGSTIGGTVNLAGGTLLDGSCSVTDNVIFGGAGKMRGNVNGYAVINGVLTLTNANLGGTLTLASNAVLNLTGVAPINISGTLTNFGTVNWSNAPLNISSSPVKIENYGVWNAQADDAVTGSFGAVTFDNFGLFRKTGGGAGSTLFDYIANFHNWAAGTIEVQAGRFSFSQFNNTGLLKCDIGGATSYGSATFGGGIILGGSFAVSLQNDYSPAAGAAFPLLNYGFVSGGFAAVNLPHLSGGLLWQTNWGASSFIVTVTNSPPLFLAPTGTGSAGGAFAFSFGAIPGQVYQVQCTTNFSPAFWINLGDPIPATTNFISISDAIGANLNRFYRVMLQ
jgi:hypothetical protein